MNVDLLFDGRGVFGSLENGKDESVFHWMRIMLLA